MASHAIDASNNPGGSKVRRLILRDAIFVSIDDEDASQLRKLFKNKGNDNTVQSPSE
jgi:hypothetical protein